MPCCPHLEMSIIPLAFKTIALLVVVVQTSISIFDVNKGDMESSLFVVFSTDCSPFQDWQSFVLLASALVVQQESVTRIASGCPPHKRKKILQIYNTSFPQYRVHFTPDYIKVNGKRFVYNNKAAGVRDWLIHADPPLPKDAIIAIIDPDFIFLRKMTEFIQGSPNLLYDKEFFRESEVIPKVIKGKAVGQRYLQGVPWA